MGMSRLVLELECGEFAAFARTQVRFPPAPALAVSKVDAAGIATRTRRWGLARGGWLGPWDLSPGPPADYPALSRFPGGRPGFPARSEEHTSELQSLMRNSYAVFCLKKNSAYGGCHNFVYY